MIKLKYLALISAWTNKIDNWIYFKYYKMDIYVLKSFANFLKLLEDGTIKVIIKKGIYTNEKRYGDMYDHGTGFTIKEKDLIKLFYRCVNNL